MPAQTVKGEDGKYYRDIPGIGRFEVPDPSMATPAAGRGAGGFNPETAARLFKATLNPELLSGAASMIPGAGTAVGAAIGGGTSAARDLLEGQTDPYGIAARAAAHAATGAIPGLAKLGVAKGIGAGAIGNALEAAGGGENFLGSAARGIASLLRSEAPMAATPARSQAQLTLETQIRALEQKLTALASNPQATAAVTRALDALKSRYTDLVTTQSPLVRRLAALLGLGGTAEAYREEGTR